MEIKTKLCDDLLQDLQGHLVLFGFDTAWAQHGSDRPRLGSPEALKRYGKGLKSGNRLDE